MDDIEDLEHSNISMGGIEWIFLDSADNNIINDQSYQNFAVSPNMSEKDANASCKDILFWPEKKNVQKFGKTKDKITAVATIAEKSERKQKIEKKKLEAEPKRKTKGKSGNEPRTIQTLKCTPYLKTMPSEFTSYLFTKENTSPV